MFFLFHSQNKQSNYFISLHLNKHEVNTFNEIYSLLPGQLMTHSSFHSESGLHCPDRVAAALLNNMNHGKMKWKKNKERSCTDGKRETIGR